MPASLDHVHAGTPMGANLIAAAPSERSPALHVLCGGRGERVREGPKRDPYARELESPFPSQCIVRRTDFPWHESGYVTSRFHDFVIYQLHVGTFFTPNLPRKGGTFLDVARRLPLLPSWA